MSRKERRALELLNSGQSDVGSIPEDRVAEFLERGLAEENSLGQVVITARGQLELARARYGLFGGSRRVKGSSGRRRLWARLFR